MASGDVVNTAARLQTAAPINGILVDESTYRATRGAIEFEPADAVEAKGKAAPTPVWTAASARSRLGMDVVHHARTGLVGREREMAILRDAFGRAAHERTTQLVTLVAVPGMGKSRLIYELSRIVDADPVLVTWRQGRCLAYGDGVAYWALAEAVKAEAGIDDRDDEAAAADKLHTNVGEVLADPTEAHWVEAPAATARGTRDRHRARERPTRRGLRRVAPLPRGTRRASTARPRPRGPPLGRRWLARLRRRARGLAARGAVARRLQRPT